MRIEEVDGDFGVGVEPVYFEPAARDAAVMASRPKQPGSKPMARGRRD